MYEESDYRPRYVVKFFPGTKLYKVIRFKIGGYEYCMINRDKHDDTEPGKKLANNLIRARTTIFQYALCNPWEWFCTMTLDKTKYDRHDLEKFRKDISQFIRDMRKEYGTKITYLIIPEQHKDGAWHMHGLFNGIPKDAIQEFIPGKSKTLQKLKRLGYKNWQDYAKKFGFVSMGKVKDSVSVAFYVTKYITKDMQNRVGEYGKHLFYSSQKLNKAENAAVYYFDEPYLDKYCTYNTEFCSIGMVYADEAENKNVNGIKDADFWLPDRYTDNTEPVCYEDLPNEAPLSIEVEKTFYELDVKREREKALTELGYDLFDHVAYKQLDLLNV